MALTIASLNVRGLRDNIKRREVLIGSEPINSQFICYKRFTPTENTNLVWRHLYTSPGLALKWPLFGNARLTLSQILPENYTMNISVALGPMPDSSKNQRQLNFCYLMARHL